MGWGGGADGGWPELAVSDLLHTSHFPHIEIDLPGKGSAAHTSPHSQESIGSSSMKNDQGWMN